MNAKTLMTTALAVMLAMTSVEIALADVSVYDVKVQPRTPWTGLVDIAYSVACDDPNADVYVTPTAYDGDRRITLFPKTLSGDGAEAPVKPGKHKMTWDAKKDLGIFSSSKFSMKIHAGERLPRYVVIDLSSGAESTEYPVRFSVVGPDLSNDICRTTELWLRLVPPGEFWMGSPTDELGRSDNEDLHHVTLTKPFYMGVFEVTQKQYELVMGEKCGYFSASENADVRPVENINSKIRGEFYKYSPISTAVDPDSFCGRVRARTIMSQLDLPSETRWEYACRAGTDTALYNGRNLISTVADEGLAKIAGYEANCRNNQGYNGSSVLIGTRNVGSFESNTLGLYDMLGNVWEWCLDLYDTTDVWQNSRSTPITNAHIGYSEVTDPTAFSSNGWDWNHSSSSYLGETSTTSSRVYRGGGWRDAALKVRAASRNGANVKNMQDDRGFRVCCEIGF